MAHGQLLVQNGNQISAFNFDGTIIKSNFITVPGTTYLQGVAVGGGYIYVADNSVGVVRQYNLDGSVAKNLLFHVQAPEGIVIEGTNVYVAQYGNGKVGNYAINGTTISASLINAGVGCTGIAICETNVFVTTFSGVFKYGLNGAQDTNFVIIPPRPQISGIAINGTNLFVAFYGAGQVGEYAFDGSTKNAALISGLNSPNGIAILNNVIYVSSDNGTVGAYDLDGTPINTNFISFGKTGSYFGLAFMPPLILGGATVTPASFSLNVNAISNQVVVIEACTNLSASIWTPIQTNVTTSINAVLTDSTWTNDRQRFYRVRAQ